MNTAQLKGFFRIFSAFVASAIMLTVIQPPFGASFLAWIALVPFIFACSGKTKLSTLLITSYIVSYFYWLGNLYWIGLVAPAGWIGLCFIMAIYAPAVAFGIRWATGKKIPLFLSAGVLFAGAEAIQGWAFGGFGWRYLAHSQHANVTIIQIADLFGTCGLSLLIAATNGLCAQLIGAVRNKKLLKPNNIIALQVVVTAVLVTVVYGRWRIAQTPSVTRPGPLVAAVQPNVSIEIKEDITNANKIFIDLRKATQQLREKNTPVLIVWPETMVQGILSDSYLQLISQSDKANIYNKALKRLSKDSSYILAGAPGADAVVENRQIRLKKKYNSAFLYTPAGTKWPKHYNKIHLVPFGETVPFKNSLPGLHKFLMKLTPYDYDYTLDTGSDYTVFEIDDGNEATSFGVCICYEDTVPYVARKLTYAEGTKRIDYLVNISNDGWFTRQLKTQNSKLYTSTELAQHTAVCVFRAVENRLSLLRSVNTGISCLIDSAGRLRNGYIDGTLPREVMARKGLSGWFVDRIDIDSRITFWSKFGQWLDFFCATCLFMPIIVAVIRRCILSKRS